MDFRLFITIVGALALLCVIGCVCTVILAIVAPGNQLVISVIWAGLGGPASVLIVLLQSIVASNRLNTKMDRVAVSVDGVVEKLLAKGEQGAFLAGQVEGAKRPP